MIYNDIVYSSGMGIWDNESLTTLCVFYDQVQLPATSTESAGHLLEFTREKGSNGPYKLCEGVIDGLKVTPIGDDQNLIPIEEYLTSWDKYYGPLFEEGAIKRLPSWLGKKNVEIEDELISTISDHLLNTPSSLIGEMKVGNTIMESIFIWEDYVVHLLRDDIKSPSLFTTSNKEFHREDLKSLLALSAFEFILPKLRLLHPDQILQIRETVADTREGFSMHLQALSEEVEKRTSEGDSLSEVSKYARSVVETKIIPDYYEFKRQLKAKKTGFWGEVADVGAEVLKIDASPWTPKFYGQLLKAFGLSLNTFSKRETMLSNKSQAFQFLRSVEFKSNDIV